MRALCQLLIAFFLLLGLSLSYATSCCGNNKPCPQPCPNEPCCAGMGGISYCDSSGGRYVCNNGYYSSCYCTRHAVMDLQLLKGCCLWQGGVMKIGPAGVVVCNNGGVSEICTLQSLIPSVSVW